MELTELFGPPAFSKARRAELIKTMIFEPAPDGLPGDCWLRTTMIEKNGYARIAGQSAHRWVYELYVGPIPEGQTVDHLCSRRNCIRPDHLEVVTRGENTLRAPNGITAQNARKTHCPKGHEYDYEQGGRRMCKTCRREHRAAYRKRLRDAGLPVR